MFENKLSMNHRSKTTSLYSCLWVNNIYSLSHYITILILAGTEETIYQNTAIYRNSHILRTELPISLYINHFEKKRDFCYTKSAVWAFFLQYFVFVKCVMYVYIYTPALKSIRAPKVVIHWVAPILYFFLDCRFLKDKENVSSFHQELLFGSS